MKSDLPLVSIIVITYNSSKYVLETLESCKTQTYKNIELIISDDCSTDYTIQVCKEWLEKNTSRFVDSKIIEVEKNTGVAGNLNRGVNEARGEWFKATAADDLLLSNCIEDNMNFVLNNNNANLVSSIKLSFKVESNGEKKIFKPKENSIFFHPSITPEDQYQLVLRNIGPTPNTWFIKKSIFENVGGCDEFFPMVEDTPLKLKFLKSGYKFFRLDKETVLYRIHSESVSSISNKKKIYKNWYI